ncbi:MAG: hypothetical protein LQ352_004925 [Teloschistes flavicans]|nr:MAG: hypothetical protein LQ352_004925 [Teloschistes flavicans]
MPTGIEVAGLALAVFPIVVKGMENLIETAETLKSWRKYRMVLAEYLQTIKDAGAFFIDTAEQLLEDIIVTRDDLDALRDDPARVVLANPRYEELLKTRLDHNYDSFLKTLQKMFAALESVQKKLGLEQKAGKMLWDDYSTIEREFKRLKIVLSRRVYMQILEEIDKANHKLRECTRQSRLLEPSRNRIRSSRTRIHFDLIRKRLKSLRNVLASKTAWNCSCEQHHATCLRLEARPQQDDPIRLEQNQIQKSKICVLLTVKSESSADQHWLWREFKIEPSEKPISYPIKAETVFSSNNTLSHDSSDQTPKGVKRSVRFDEQVAHDKLAILQSSSPLRAFGGALKEISSLCSITQVPVGQKAPLGFLMDKSADGQQHNMFPTKNAVVPLTDHKSLQELLEVSRQRGLEHGLRWADSLQIAITLASSVIQLDGTGWLKSQWSSQDIIFPLSKGSKDGQCEVDHSYPYTTSGFGPHKTSTHAQSPESLTDTTTVVHCEALVALGVTLVELCCGQAIEQLQKPQDNCANAAMIRWNTARRLLGCVYSERGEKYGSVVNRCLEGRFDVASKSLEDEDLQQAVFDLVVVPLQTELRCHTVG